MKIVSHSSINQKKISGFKEKTKGLEKSENHSRCKKDRPFHLAAVTKAWSPASPLVTPALKN